MREWRVGTFSMGISLLLLGVGLLFTQILKLDVGKVMLSWWPVLFIILGIEILLYLFNKKNEQSYIKFDFFSIFFVGIIGTVGIGLTILHATGFHVLIDEYVFAQHRTVELPKYEEKVSKDITRIFIDADEQKVHLEAMEGQEVSLFGTLTGRMTSSKVLSETSDYALIEQQGDTLYIKLKQPQHKDIANDWYFIDLMMIVPSHMDVEFANAQELELNPRAAQSDWMVSEIGSLQMASPYAEEVKLKDDSSIQQEKIQLQDKHQLTIKNISHYME